MNRSVLFLFLFTFSSFYAGLYSADNFVFPSDDDEDKPDEIDNRYGAGGSSNGGGFSSSGGLNNGGSFNNGGFGYPQQQQNFNQRRPNQRQKQKRPNGNQQWMNLPEYTEGLNFFYQRPNQNRNNQRNFNQQRPNQQRPNQGWGNFNRRPGFNQQWNNQQNQQNQNFNQQNFNQQNQNNGWNQFEQQLSPQVQACIEACTTQSPAQYDPVCGDNGRTYRNRDMFDCSVECGEQVQILNIGACPRPTIPPWSPSGPELLGIN